MALFRWTKKKHQLKYWVATLQATTTIAKQKLEIWIFSICYCFSSTVLFFNYYMAFVERVSVMRIQIVCRLFCHSTRAAKRTDKTINRVYAKLAFRLKYWRLQGSPLNWFLSILILFMLHMRFNELTVRHNWFAISIGCVHIARTLRAHTHTPSDFHLKGKEKK